MKWNVRHFQSHQKADTRMCNQSATGKEGRLWLASTHQADSTLVTLILLQMPYVRVVDLTFLCL